MINTKATPLHNATAGKAIKFCNIIIEAGWLLIFFLVPLIFLPIIYSVVHIAEYVVFQMLVEIIVFVWIVKLIITYRHHKLKSFRIEQIKFVLPLFIALGFFIILGISTVLSSSPYMSFFGNYDRKMGYITWLHFFAFFLILFFNLKNREQIRRIFYTIIGATAVSVLYGFIQISGFDPFTWREPAYLTHRIFSTFGQPNFFASWLVLVIPVIISIVFLSRAKAFHGVHRGQTSMRGLTSMRRVRRALVSGLVVLFFASMLALVLTQSRGGWVGAFFGFFFFVIIFLLLKKYKRAAISFLALLVICIGALVYFNFNPITYSPDDTFLQRRAKTFTQLSAYGERRLMTWQNSIDLIKQKPWIGYGPETQKFNFITYYTPQFAALEAINTYPDRAHNDILDTILMSGILGLIFYISFIALIFYFALTYVFKNYQDSLSIVMLSLLTGIFAYLISLQFSFHTIPSAVYFWAYLAILLKILWVQHHRGSTPRRG